MANPFQTPANEKSFSGLIDQAILITGKPASLVSIVANANAVVRECQALGLFARDMVEDEIIVPTPNTSPVIWNRPVLFKSLRTVKYVNCNVYPKLALPGKKQQKLSQYFYASDNYFVFAGAPAGETIALATYYWRTSLGYFAQLGTSTVQFSGGPYAVRPAYYDSDAGKWQYLNTAGDAYEDTTGDLDTDALRQRQASNWLTEDWEALILAGTIAKTFNKAGDPRATGTYSDYKQQQAVLKNTAQYEGEDF